MCVGGDATKGVYYKITKAIYYTCFSVFAQSVKTTTPAEFHCEERGNSYCGECLKWRHNGKRKNHQRITRLSPKSQQSGECMEGTNSSCIKV